MTNRKSAHHLFWALELVLLVLLAPYGVAQPDLTVDLAEVSEDDGVLRRIYGSGGSGRLGVPVAGGADLDGDGHADYAIGYMTVEALGRVRAGEVDLMFGDGSIIGSVDTAAADPNVLRFVGAGPRETAGSEIWIDDVTGDGLGDLLICRQNYSLPEGRIGAGALTIVAGGAELRAQAASLTTVDLLAPPSQLTLTTLIGARALDRLCIWVRTGDVDGDGTADIVVGADQVDGPGESNRGAVFVIRGGSHLASGNTIDLLNFGSTPLVGHLAEITPPQNSQGYHLGATCQVADLDGNGRAEVLAAAALNRAGAGLEAEGAPSGSAESFGGAPDGNLYIAWDDNFPQGLWPAGFSFDISASPGSRTIITGESVNISFGEEILGGLDYDGDGLQDLFVGDLTGDGTQAQDRASSGLGHVFFAAGGLKGLEFDLDSPPVGLQISRILGSGSGDFGADTAAHGDFDRDFRDDLAFASPHADPQGRNNAGAVHILYGQEGAWPALIDLRPGNLPPTAEIRIGEIQGEHGTVGTDAGDTLGYSAAAGDIDSDGFMDLIVNEMVGNGVLPGTEDVGNLILLSGRALADLTIFADGFESGDVSAWSGSFPLVQDDR
ncbi:MAG: integrin alpha [Deltaproteobacteria bacterium]|nr:integrin alpha [Deltaproteobacteria bacterium]